ncbi:MAG: class I SAM-dependent methyltransferase [Chthoniobacter sp.]|uniref:class I SAM-dependent methyltransferase n=1 Tax=Chthoniobacter sp. TaxID=2510640 RepID=UPI0032AD53CF
MNPHPPQPTGELWSTFASAWSRLGPPLRPCPEDLQRLHQAWTQSLPAGIPSRRLEILSLGVTPEIALFPWASDFHLTAIDASEGMIGSVWPGDAPNRRAVLGDWLEMPFPDASFDLVLTDTGLALVAGTGKLSAAGRELRRVLRQDGRAAMRHFARPSPPESLDSIAQAAGAGRLSNFHELKLRLLMAVEAENPGTAVRLADVYDRFQSLFSDRDLLARQLGCDHQIVSTIDAYRGRETLYAFPSLAELAVAFDAFHLAPGPAGHYPAAGCCPVFSLTPKQ